MNNIKINSASYSFLGVFQYEDHLLHSSNISKDFEPLDLYPKNQKYFDQKYYSNWIHSFFLNKEKGETTRHLRLKSTNSLFQKDLKINVGKDPRILHFSIREVDVFFFEANLGIVLFKIDLPKLCCNWEDIVHFGNEFRRSTINEWFPTPPISVKLMEQHITSKFHSDPQDWRQFNPQLKAAIFVDIDQELDNDTRDHLLYKLGTFTVPFQEKNLHDPEEQYLKLQMDNNSISLFKNWTTLCLYDSIARIAVKLNKEDQFKLWENEYILIYVYVLYARYFLHHTNNQLSSIFSNNKLVEKKRNSFFNFINEFNHSKISYKFLPNEIYNQFKKSLEIEDEIKLIEEKLTRVNILRQEGYEKRVNKILFMLTMLTLISVAYDGGQMFQKFEWSQSLKISMSILAVASLIMSFIFFSKKD